MSVDSTDFIAEEHLLVQNTLTGDLIECKVDSVGKLFVYVMLGCARVKFFRSSGKGYDGDYRVLACGEAKIDELRKSNFADMSDADNDRSRLEIPKTEPEEGTLGQVAELLARRVALHWNNKDFDGAIRILESAKAEYFNREKDLKEAAKSNGLSSPLTLLGLSVRITNALERAGCDTIFDLCIRDGGSLMLGAGLGPTSYESVRQRLDEHGFDHRMEPLVIRKAS